MEYIVPEEVLCEHCCVRVRLGVESKVIVTVGECYGSDFNMM